jgi:hypothetical protein
MKAGVLTVTADKLRSASFTLITTAHLSLKTVIASSLNKVTRSPNTEDDRFQVKNHFF